ncbi:glycerate dehydrogenase [Paenibacillus sp. J31TS4]|uniref:D-2-hydroxyacid dehydrogenase n=1 Tax=Paenibacillus sp. J31TS4 TaxID=2807195 RepID=UPI001B219C5A|nr:D-2-hydroxyacid dehydrogenase [Paenibacillus sp. J31TS4]GIP38132.1 glycerate dehydrogenase [Paenibacillus sp. J31TS4]
MKIVVLDGFTLNPGDLSWDDWQSLGEVTVYDRTPPELVAERAGGAQAVLTNKTPLSADTLAALPELRYVGVLATGYNVVDIEACRQAGITVTNVPDYSTFSVAQLVFSLLLEFANGVSAHAEAVRQGEWSTATDFCFFKTPQTELAGKQLGIIGYGQIGRQVGRLAEAFGMRVAAWKRPGSTKPEEPGVRYQELDRLLAESDVVSLHCPLTEETKGMVDRAFLAKMKRQAILINTARGGLVNEQDLADALIAGTIAGAGLDVLAVEPPRAGSPLLAAPNCLITPHIAWATREARWRLMKIAEENLKAYLDGKPENVVG